jgi:hypothetical protein
MTENRGTATIPNGSTSVSVCHGLASTTGAPPPGAVDFQVTPTNGLGNAAEFWIDPASITPTQFTIRVDVDPGAEGATFVWQAVKL